MTRKEQLEKQLRELKEKRKKYQMMAENADVYQHSTKILLNSAYGAFGSAFYPLYDIDIAESTTIGGKTATQEMVRYVNKYMNNLQGTENEEFIVAGDTDSVDGSSVVTIDGKTAEDLFNLYKNKVMITVLASHKSLEYWPEVIDFIEHEKNTNEKINEFTYSLNGKSKIKNIQRHKVNKAKYKISIDEREVIMTGDHSIMVYRDGQVIECKPSEIKQTDYLLKRKDEYK